MYKYTIGGKSQLSADNCGIGGVPVIITDCSPDIVVTDFHTTSKSIYSTLKSYGILSTTCKMMNSRLHIIHNFMNTLFIIQLIIITSFVIQLVSTCQNNKMVATKNKDGKKS